MSHRRAVTISVILGLMMASMAVLPFIMMTLPKPLPVASTTPGAVGNGVYVRDSAGCYKLFPRATLPDEWPTDAFRIRPDAEVFVRARQYDEFAAYGIYAFRDGRAHATAVTLTDDRLLHIAPTPPLAPGNYVVKVSRDDAWGGSDYFFLTVSP